MQTQKSQLNAREFLLEELTRRSRNNPRYSLRAFAKTLGVTPAAISMVLTGRRRVGRRLAEQVIAKLGLGPDDAQAIRSECGRQGLASPVQGAYSRLPLDQFALIAEWYHFAILSLTETRGFKPSYNWIASRLRISPSEATSAVERMVRMGILDISKPAWKQIGAPILVENKISTSATRQNQRQVLEKAIESLENDPMELRDMSSMTIAIDPRLIPLAREEIGKFRVRLMNLLEQKGGALEVYHLALQIYPVSTAQTVSKKKRGP